MYVQVCIVDAANCEHFGKGWIFIFEDLNDACVSVVVVVVAIVVVRFHNVLVPCRRAVEIII